MTRKIRVGVLFGGESAEHEVSLQSALNVVQAIDREKYEVVLLGIDKRGRWHVAEGSRFLLNAADPRRIRLGRTGESVALRPGHERDKLVPVAESEAAGPGAEGSESGGSGARDGPRGDAPIDVVFPVLHGPMGEDGSVQGFLRLAHLPFVGAGVLGSAVAMDKDVTKRLLRDAGIPVAPFLAMRRGADRRPGYDELAERLGEPFFVKPANLGSSVGVHKVHGPEELSAALDDAFSYDRKVLVEAFIAGRELECSVLGNDDPIASVPGEVIARHEFYSYEAKYLDEEGADLRIPAELPEEVVRLVQRTAVRAFLALECEGMARVDFFLQEDGTLLVNELNSIPGFTRISMYPKLWEASGIGYPELIDRLIELALERHEEQRALRSSVELEKPVPGSTGDPIPGSSADPKDD